MTPPPAGHAVHDEASFYPEVLTRRGIVVTRLRDADAVDGIVLGGTELPLPLATPEVAGVPVLDTKALRTAAIVERLRGNSEC